jgi:hypothetical protein
MNQKILSPSFERKTSQNGLPVRRRTNAIAAATKTATAKTSWLK